MTNIEFLNFTIVKSNDIVLVSSTGQHFGFYSSVEDAKKGAVRHFMIQTPALAQQVEARMTGSFLYHDFYAFRTAVISAGLKMPAELNASTCGNCTLQFKGENI